VAAFSTIEHNARDEIMKLGGSISHHHGIGKLRKGWLPETVSPVGVQVPLSSLLFSSLVLSSLLVPSLLALPSLLPDLACPCLSELVVPSCVQVLRGIKTTLDPTNVFANGNLLDDVVKKSTGNQEGGKA
jgi:FAD/FMN-containing dehydrogenase